MVVIAFPNYTGISNKNFQQDWTVPYGTPTFMNASFTAAANAIGNTHLFTGRERDPETGLQLNRRRFYHALLGRWLTRDPFVYIDSYNLYEYARSRPMCETGKANYDRPSGPTYY